MSTMNHLGTRASRWAIQHSFAARLPLSARSGSASGEESEAVAGLLEIHHGDATAVAAKLGRTERWVHLRARIQKLSSEFDERA